MEGTVERHSDSLRVQTEQDSHADNVREWSDGGWNAGCERILPSPQWNIDGRVVLRIVRKDCQLPVVAFREW